MTPSVAPAVRTLGHLLHGFVNLPAEFDCQLQGLELDSRRVQPGTLFMACKGQSSDGRKFVDEAIARGAGAVLAEAGDGWQGLSVREAVPVVAIDALPEHMAELAARFYACPAQQLQLIGVTGTNGKTSCCQLVARLFTAIGTPCGVIGTLGYGMSGEPLQQDEGIPGTTPDAISLQRQLAALLARGARAVAMEVSSHGLHQHRVNVGDFAIALFTNLTRDHLDLHGTMQAYGETKRRLFTGDGLKLAILNADDAYVLETRELVPATCQTFTWGINAAGVNINAVNVHFHGRGQQIEIATPWGQFLLDSQLIGAFNTSNLLGALTLVLAAQSSKEDFNPVNICNQAGALPPVTGRMQLIEYPAAPLTVVVDYAHTPDALEKALLAMRQHCAGRLWCVFGCGGDRDRGKRAQMGVVAEQLADQLVITNDNPRFESSQQILTDIQSGLIRLEKSCTEPDRAKAIEYAIAHAAPGDSILIAGKGHELYQEIRGVRLPFSDVAQAGIILSRAYPQGDSRD